MQIAWTAANNKMLAPLVAQSGLDYIEAFTPPPDCDLSVGEAMRVWPGKIIWINFPSSVHLQGAEEIDQAAIEILDQARPFGNRLIFGATEDVPEDHWRESYAAIMRTLRRCGPLAS